MCVHAFSLILFCLWLAHYTDRKSLLQSYVTHILEGLRGIVTVPAKLESTALVFTYKVDLFFTRIAPPSRTYDSLTEDFSYALLLITIVALLVAIFVTWVWSERKELQEKWRWFKFVFWSTFRVQFRSNRPFRNNQRHLKQWNPMESLTTLILQGRWQNNFNLYPFWFLAILNIVSRFGGLLLARSITWFCSISSSRVIFIRFCYKIVLAFFSTFKVVNWNFQGGINLQ